MPNVEEINKIICEFYEVAKDEPLFCCKFRSPIVERGYLLKPELHEIVCWKAERVKSIADRNSDSEVKSASRAAFAAPTPEEAVAILDSLKGVGVRMASAIMTVYDPSRFTVMDIRAMESLRAQNVEDLGLGEKVNLDSPKTYASYLTACKRLADMWGIDLRTLDRYLWSMDRKQSAGKGRKPPQPRCRRVPRADK